MRLQGESARVPIPAFIGLRCLHGYAKGTIRQGNYAQSIPVSDLKWRVVTRVIPDRIKYEASNYSMIDNCSENFQGIA